LIAGIDRAAPGWWLSSLRTINNFAADADAADEKGENE